MSSRYMSAICLLSSILLALACGSDPSGSGGSGGEHSLGWGQDLADQVRDSQYPEAELFYIACVDINDDGERETAVPWTFYYADSSDTTNVLAVIVQYIGTTDYFWQNETTVPLSPLPDYDDAGPWLDAARDSLGADYSDWEEYALTVQGNEYEEYPLTLNVAIIQFMSPDTTEQLSAIIDADSNTLLGYVEY